MQYGRTSRYTDHMIEIDDQGILLRNYYASFGLPFDKKYVSFSEIERIEVLPNTIWNGKWRLQGTGDFRTWFILDWKRPKRDRVFMIYRKDTRWRIGFTAVNGAQALEALRGRLGKKMVQADRPQG